MMTPIVVPLYGRFLLKQQRENIRVTKWFKDDGDFIEKGELVVVVETSKASLEFDSPASGFLLCLKKVNEKANLDETIGMIADTREEFESERQDDHI